MLSCSSKVIKSILNVLDKFSFTEELIKQLPYELGIKADEVYPLWWKNIRAGGGWRLTALGYKVMTDHVGIEKYIYTIPEDFFITPQLMLKLDRKLKNPYYVLEARKVPTHIIFFGSKEAMMANLYGDLKKFIDSYQ